MKYSVINERIEISKVFQQTNWDWAVIHNQMMTIFKVQSFFFLMIDSFL